MIQNELNDQQYNFVAEEVGLSELLRPLWVRRWQIVFFTLMMTLIVAAYISQLKPSYKATAILQIGSNKPNSTLSIDDAFHEKNASKEQIQTQYELLRSRKFAERVVSRLSLTKDPEFLSGKYKDSGIFFRNDKATEVSVSSAVGSFASKLAIVPINNTELVRISFTSYSPKLSQRIANQIGETYLEYQDEIHSVSKESTSQWLVDQLEELGKKLDASELALQKFREQEDIVDINGVAGLVGSELTALTASSLKAVKAKDDLYVTYLAIQEDRSNHKKLLDLREVSNDKAYVQLRRSEEEIERKFFEMAKRYGPKHPKFIAVQAELESIQIRIRNQVIEVTESLENDYQSAIAKIKANEVRVSKAKQDFLRLSRLQNKFSQLQREVATNKQLYSNYLVRLKETDAMGNYKSNFYIRFIDKAIEPKGKSAPRSTLIVMVAFVLSMVVISILILMREMLKDTLNSQRKLESFTDADVLAILPRSKIMKATSGGVSNGEAIDHRFVEAVRTLRTSLLFNNEKKAAKVIAITSSVPNEGKSTVALELAKSYAEMEKVLLIEADLRNPTLSKTLDLDMHRPGLSNLLAKTHQINECIIRDKHVKLDVLTSGISPANPLAFLSMKRFNMLIKVFGNFYDRIIIETPPVNAVSDAVIISRLVDSVIYIVHGEKTPREQISAGLRMLRQAKAPVEGLVINQSENIDTARYHNKYYQDTGNIIKLPVRKRG